MKRFGVGDKVSASRNETGEDHEPGVVVDSYELIIGEERRAMVVIEFEDGERRYLTSSARNVILVEPANSEPEPAAEEAPEAEAEPGSEDGADGAEEEPAPVATAVEDDGEPEGRP
jgi:hypothetical protein